MNRSAYLMFVDRLSHAILPRIYDPLTSSCEEKAISKARSLANKISELGQINVRQFNKRIEKTLVSIIENCDDPKNVLESEASLLSAAIGLLEKIDGLEKEPPK